MAKWENGVKLWDIGIYFVDGRKVISGLNTPQDANIPYPHRWITTIVGDTYPLPVTVAVRTYDISKVESLRTPPYHPPNKLTNHASTSFTIFGRPGFPPPIAFLAFNSAIRC